MPLRPCQVNTHPWLHQHQAQGAQMQRASDAYCKNDSQGHASTPRSICDECVKKNGAKYAVCLMME